MRCRLTALAAGSAQHGRMKHQPLQLLVQEPLPGSFVWMLMETDADGRPVRVARRAEDACASYEAALAAGTRVLSAQLHHAVPAQG